MLRDPSCPACRELTGGDCGTHGANFVQIHGPASPPPIIHTGCPTCGPCKGMTPIFIPQPAPAASGE